VAAAVVAAGPQKVRAPARPCSVGYGYEGNSTVSQQSDVSWREKGGTHLRKGLPESRLCDIPGVATGSERTFVYLGRRDRAGGHFVREHER
jgi:hypothetical protein